MHGWLSITSKVKIMRFDIAPSSWVCMGSLLYDCIVGGLMHLLVR